ncbi:MAG: hypothetical protein WCK90_03920 [archaeon]
MIKQYELRQQFLKEFFGAAIATQKRRIQFSLEDLNNPQTTMQIRKMIRQSLRNNPKFQEPAIVQISPTQNVVPPISMIQRPAPIMRIPSAIRKPVMVSRPQTQMNVKVQNKPVQPSLQATPATAQTVKELSMGRLMPIILDPAVQSVECPGPGKNILVNRSGIIQTAPIVLSAEEIKSIMNDISDKTRIPLISGVFKSVINNLVITAVISEFVGTRFVIQKMSPLSVR